MNFATLYGQGARALSKQLKIDTNMARKLIEDYFTQFGSIKKWMAEVLEEGRKNGYVETIWGRRRYIPELNMQNKMLQSFGERAAINHPIQGTSADMIKKAMIEIDKSLESRVSKSAKPYKSQGQSCQMILQVHDELLFECEPSDLKETAKLIKEKMESVISLKVPVVVDLKSGKNWGEMSPLTV
jgi:DNA polymerase-1